MKLKEHILNIGFLIFKYGIYAILVSLIVMKCSGYSFQKLIYNHKAKSEKENILYGGPLNEVNKYIEARNDKVQELFELVRKKATELDTIQYYTNDTLRAKHALIRENRTYRSTYVNPNQIGKNYIAASKETIKNIDDFKAKEDSLGYFIFIDRGKGNELIVNNFSNKLSSKLHIKSVNNTTNENKYKIIKLYHYSDSEKKYLTKKINERHWTWFRASNTTPEKEIALLKEIQIATIRFTEKELQNQQLFHDTSKTMWPPKFELSPNSVFYFSSYHKKLDKRTFLSKIALFKTMFFKKQSRVKGAVQSVKVKLEQQYEE